MVFLTEVFKSLIPNNGKGTEILVIEGYDICTRCFSETISVGDDEEIEINHLKNHFSMKVSMIFEIEINEEHREEIISLFWNFINLKEETIDLDCIFLTEFFHVSNVDLEIVQIGHILQTMLFENLVISFSEKSLELEDEIIQNCFIFMRSFEKGIHEVHEFITADDRVNESGNLVGDHENGENSKV